MRMLCPIEYEIHGVTRTNRRPSRYLYSETVAVDIPEVSDAAAPIAVEWVPTETFAPYRHATSDCVISGPDGKQLTRWYSNAHWQRLCDGHFYGKKVEGPAISVADLQSMLETPTQNSAARVAIGLTRQIKPKASSKIVDVSQDPRGRFLSIRMDGREAAMKYLDEAVAGLIAVNGIVHLRCIEPFISVALDVGNGEPKIRGLGIETTTQALWGPGTTTFAFFGLSKWDEAIQFAEGLGWTGTVTSEPIAELRVLLQESLTYDWGISYKAAVEARAMQKALTMFSRVFEPRLEKVIHSQDADEQYEVMLSLDHDDPRWQDNATAQRSYEKAIAILENRTINMSLQKTLGMRP